MDDAIANFVGITGANDAAAQQILDMCGGDVEQAVQLWFTDEELQRNLSNPIAASSSTSALPLIPHSTRPPAGREDASGVIHLDSDDNDDIEMMGDESHMQDGVAEAATVARSAQEEEDAAMAKRLQEELYGQPAVDEDGIRAPMARTTETLVAPSGPWGMGGPLEGDDAITAAIVEQLRRRRQQSRPRGNPFAQSIWADPSSAGPPQPGSTGPQSRAQRLAELFRPPYDLILHVPWDEARDLGKEEKKWILVNLQNMSDFNCQALNRDIWKDNAIQQLVRENFVFLQYNKDDEQAQQYVTFYMANNSHENPDNFPHVSIIDPRTGEQVKVWSGIPFPSALDFHTELAEFLDRFSLAANSKNPVVKAKRPERTVDVDRMTEDEMLHMAMQNSLDAASGSNDSSAKPSVHDPDGVTKPSTEQSSGAESKGKEVEAAPPTPAAPADSVFAQIPSDRPHTEPTSADPTTTTRIQFRHPTGRVIRRFSLNETVARIYEWLKAEPLEDKEGVEFELKVMPQGKDLLEDLDKMIGEAGLKQGTVMIEFI